MRSDLLSVCAVLAATSGATAQAITYTGPTYTQNFDGLSAGVAGPTVAAGHGPHALSTVGFAGAVGVDGWYGGNHSGTGADSEFRAQDGSLASGRGVVSFGASGSEERALGALSPANNNQAPRFGALFQNNTGQTLTQVTISFTGEQWRIGNVVAVNTLQFFYALANSIADPQMTSFSALNFSGFAHAPGTGGAAADGNAAENRLDVSATITGLNWVAGDTLAIAWQSDVRAGVQNDGLAIDNFSFTAVPSPGGVAALSLGAAAFAGRRRR